MSRLRTALLTSAALAGLLVACGGSVEIDQPAPPPVWPMGGASPDQLDLDNRAEDTKSTPPTAPPDLAMEPESDDTDDAPDPAEGEPPADTPPSP